MRQLQSQLHPQRLRNHQAVVLDPKLSSNQPPLSRNNWNAIQHYWILHNSGSRNCAMFVHYICTQYQ